MTYQSKNLSTKFNVKDKREFYHQSHIVYYGKSGAATGGVLSKKVFLRISQNSQENTCASLFFNKVAGGLLLY